MLILVYQTNYFGKIIQGRPPPPFLSQHIPPGLRTAASIPLQLGTSRSFRGCCRRQCCNKYKRYIVLDEFHFLHHYNGAWDLYLLPMGHASPQQSLGERRQLEEPCCPFFQFCLVPQNHHQQDHLAAVQMDKKDWPGWRFLGECQPSILRIDFDETIRMTLKTFFGLQASESIPEYHCHVVAFLPEFIDHNHHKPEEIVAAQQQQQQQRHPKQQQQESKNHASRPPLGPGDINIQQTPQKTKQQQHRQQQQQQPHKNHASRPPLRPCNINTHQTPQKTKHHQQQPKKQSSRPPLGTCTMNMHKMPEKTKKTQHQQQPEKQGRRPPLKKDLRWHLGSPYFR
jgi:hypothetical protein